MNIIQAFEAMENGRIATCFYNNLYYRKHKTEVGSYDMSAFSDFSQISMVMMEFSINEITSEWVIIEAPEKQKPCIFCGVQMFFRLTDPSLEHENRWYLECVNIRCLADSPLARTRDDAIKTHNDMYNKIKMEDKIKIFSNEKIKNHLRKLAAMGYRSGAYISQTDEEHQAIEWAKNFSESI